MAPGSAIGRHCVETCTDLSAAAISGGDRCLRSEIFGEFARRCPRRAAWTCRRAVGKTAQMKAPKRLLLLLPIFALAQLSCGSDDDAPPIEQLCEKTYDCNWLPGDVTVQECVDQTNDCLDKLDKADRADWDDLARECLKIDDCQEFNACYRGMNPSEC